MNDRLMAFIVVGIAFAGFLYIFLNPAAIKSANKATNWEWIGFGKKPIWFFRAVGAAGTLAGGLLLLHIILSKSN
jgi:hypothetical protein